MKIHFIGIGGIGMSALAGISIKEDYEVSGSDSQETPLIEELKKMGARIYIGHKKENLPSDANLVVYTTAVRNNNPELLEAKRQKIKTLERAGYLGQVMSAKKGIAVAGTHGKTTISSMLSVILKNAGLDPSLALGGIVPEFNNKNWRNGNGDYMVVEACEYKKAFLALKPFISIISNIEEEHMDCFKDKKDVLNTFERFLLSTSKLGFAVVGLNNINTQKILNNNEFSFPVYTYGNEGVGSDWEIRNVQEEKGMVKFEVYKHNQKIEDFELSIPGRHNAFNALAATIVSAELGVNLKTIKVSLLKFKGSRRRSEKLGEKQGVLVVDDYAHHPTEIKATLTALRNFYSDRKKMWCVFQPHQYSRTKLFFNDFISSFEIPDKVIIPDIYEVRDKKDDVTSVNSEMFVNSLKNKGVEASYIPTFEKIATYLKKNTEKGDFIVTMGAGPVDKIGKLFLK